MSWFKKILSLASTANTAQDEAIELSTEMKYLIVGLGNIGAEYHYTRHNIGFEVMDALAKVFDVPFKTEKLGDVAEFKFKGRLFVLLKPSTYMNLSGKAVNYWLQKKKIDQDKLLVIVDDLNIPFGKLRLRGKGSDGGHNGIKDINETIGSKYARLRFGIGNEFGQGKQVNFVLGKWSEEENKTLPALIETATEAIKSFATAGLANTMSEYN